jgi:S1/P1 Nuclease
VNRREFITLLGGRAWRGPPRGFHYSGASAYNGRTRCRQSNSSGTEAKVELHSVWDSCLVHARKRQDVRHARRRSARKLDNLKGHPATSGTMMEWMKETHQAGVDTAYDALSNGDDLAGVYIQHALPVVQQQLLNAGIRLPKIIDENFEAQRKPPSNCYDPYGRLFTLPSWQPKTMSGAKLRRHGLAGLRWISCTRRRGAG